jgi:quercetin dioxygenase-like cupin family protein
LNLKFKVLLKLLKYEAIMYVMNIRDAEELKTPHGKSIKWLLSKENGVPNFEMRYFEVTKDSKPSEDKHPWEHEVFIVRGEGIVRSGGVEQKVGFGDAIFIPPDELHQFSNFGDEPFGFICIIPKGCEDKMKDKK